MDPALNIRLAAALKSAKDQGVPKENIQKALARAGGASNGSGQHFVYEALAHDSVGLIIECLTDNANRSLHNVRDILTSYGARMTPVKSMFERQGLVTVALDKSVGGGFNKLFDIAIENGAEEVNERRDLETEEHIIYEISCAPTQLAQLATADWNQGLVTPLATVLSSELAYVPSDPQPLPQEEQQSMDELVAELEADNDTTRIWTTVALSS
ncbi:unnamed protein product [Cyclocybe aegerita]|uniref:TACO1/YebC-like second and third domain-containing protein n=1 Tax=Cyclocybe aegerita TaxID=1973307 RepID=A0A8S0WCR5_CYCAE|nr:unnamed protein product [Cyclocybe aegerita]